MQGMHSEGEMGSSREKLERSLLMLWPPIGSNVRIGKREGDGPTRIASTRGWSLGRRIGMSRPKALSAARDGGQGTSPADRPVVWAAKVRRALLSLSPFAVIALTGCPITVGTPKKLPDCLTGLPTEAPKPAPTNAKNHQALIGLDGSDSMLGFAEAKQDVWRRFLQSINQGIASNGLKPVTYRIGGGDAEGPISGWLTQGLDPCFFKGCGRYKAVTSSLATLWSVKSKTKIPLRLLISDLEVNQNDISSLLPDIRRDIDKGASAGILGLQAPFKGNIFGADGRVLGKASTNRPVFILATGPEAEVASVLESIRKTLALKQISSAKTRLSVLRRGNSNPTLTAQWIGGEPVAASTEVPVQIGSTTYKPYDNPNYQFARMNPNMTGLSIASKKGLAKGAAREDFGIAELEELSVRDSKPQAAQGMRIANIDILGRNLTVDIDLDQSVASGSYRIVVPAGSLPEQWWLEWDRSQTDTASLGEKTEGLLDLMTTLSQEIARSSNAPPSAAMCFALQN